MESDRLRASDADREWVVERLGAAAAEGRLDLSEFDERVQMVYAAKTYGELNSVLADLPGTAKPGWSDLVRRAPVVAARTGAPAGAARGADRAAGTDTARYWSAEPMGLAMWLRFLAPGLAATLGIPAAISLFLLLMSSFIPGIEGPADLFPGLVIPIGLGILCSGLFTACEIANNEPRKYAERVRRQPKHAATRRMRTL
jgi:hypothetical protein